MSDDRERDHRRQRPGRIHGRAVHVAREPASRWSSRASSGAACSSRRRTSRTTPGSPTGIMGPELMQQFRDQAERFGARFITDQATKVELADEPGGDPQGVGRRRRVPRPHGRPGHGRRAQEARHPRRGGARRPRASPTAPPATPPSSGTRETVIVGGGDSAMEEAIFLAKFASKVYDRPPPRRVPRLEDHARARPRDRQHRVPHAVRGRGVRAEGDGPLAHVARLRNVETGEERELPIGGAFIADRPRAAVRDRRRPGRDRRRGLRHHRGQVDADRRPGRVRRRRPRRPHLPPGGHRRRLAAARRRSTPSGTCATRPRSRRPQGMPEGDLAEAQWARPA